MDDTQLGFFLYVYALIHFLYIFQARMNWIIILSIVYKYVCCYVASCLRPTQSEETGIKHSSTEVETTTIALNKHNTFPQRD